jgi:hypothetical protein
MGSRFIPDGDYDFARMARGFASAIVRDPKRYLLSDVDAEALARKVQAFEDALSVAKYRPTRGSHHVFAKNEHRKEAEEMIRRLGAMIRASDKISWEDKEAAGVKRRSTNTRRLKCPIYPPLLVFRGAVGEGGSDSVLHELIVEPGFNLRGEQKREGAVRMELFVDLVGPGEPVPRHPGEFLGNRPWYLGSFNTSPIRVSPPIPPVPMLVVYWVRWADSSCRVGRFSKTCQARWEGARQATKPTLGAMPEVRQLANDPKQITVLTQFRERYLEAPRVERMLEDSRAAGEEMKQLKGPLGSANESAEPSSGAA